MAFSTDQSPIFLLFFLALLFSSTHAIRHQTQNPESPVFSLSLHHRDSVINPQRHNYTARVVSSLAGDSARLKYINSRLRKALFSSDQANSFQTEAIQAPVTVSGGGYLARIGVGKPVKQFYFIADTGSDVTWLQCKPCKKCYPQTDPIFDPSKSSSYQPLPCASDECVALSTEQTCDFTDTGPCTYGAVYGDKTFSMGDFATETLSFGSDSVNNVSIGCGNYNQGLKGFAGIFGLARSEVAFPSQINATSFSYCLVKMNSNSSSTLEFNSAAPAGGDSVVVPLVQNPFLDMFYYVELTGITIGGDQVQIPPSVYEIGDDGTGGIIVDSGTTVTYLDSGVYDSVRDSFRNKTRGLTLSKANLLGFDTCYDIPTGSAYGTKVPAMSFQFSGGETLSLPPENYFLPVAVSKNGKVTKFCLAFQATKQVVSIIGNTQQQGMRVTYDLAGNFISFSPNKC